MRVCKVQQRHVDGGGRSGFVTLFYLFVGGYICRLRLYSCHNEARVLFIRTRREYGLVQYYKIYYFILK